MCKLIKNISCVSCNKNLLGLHCITSFISQFYFHFYCLGFISPITTITQEIITKRNTSITTCIPEMFIQLENYFQSYVIASSIEDTITPLITVYMIMHTCFEILTFLPQSLLEHMVVPSTLQNL